ncbi:hypothetical protein STEG23_037213 [Scotinomys teguina]
MGSPTTRPEHTNTEEAKFINKNDLQKVIEALNEEMKNSLKNWKNKQTKKMEENKETQEKAIKQMKDTVPDVKIEIESIKKTQSEGRLEIENLTKRTGTTDISKTNRMQEMEQRISDGEEKIDSSVKEHSKQKSRNTKVLEIWDTIKVPNVRIIGIKEGEEYHLKGTEYIWSKIIGEKLPNIKKEISMKIQEAYRTPNRQD